MHRSRFENRAKLLRKKRTTEELPTTMTPAEYWSTKVHSTEDVITYYHLYHPEIGDELTLALAHMFERGVRGEIQLADYWLMGNNKNAHYNAASAGEDLLEMRTPEEEHVLQQISQDQFVTSIGTWDYKKEMEAQKTAGLVKLSQQRLENLLIQEKGPQDKKEEKKV